jgi:hypothetical protein
VPAFKVEPAATFKSPLTVPLPCRVWPLVRLNGATAVRLRVAPEPTLIGVVLGSVPDATKTVPVVMVVLPL